MSNQFDESEVLHLAQLAHINLRDDEVKRLTTDLNVINDAIASIKEVAGEDVESTLHPLPLSNVFRDDIPATLDDDLLTNEQALAGGPATDCGQFIAPQILSED